MPAAARAAAVRLRDRVPAGRLLLRPPHRAPLRGGPRLPLRREVHEAGEDRDHVALALARIPPARFRNGNFGPKPHASKMEI